MVTFKQMITGFKNQVENASLLGNNITFNNVGKVLICGMGGSSLPGDFIKSLFYPLSFELSICRDYVIPDYIDENYLCFCISYSGNTEETISMYKKLLEKTRKIVIITSGGELEKLGEKYNTPVIKVPVGLQPRMAIGYQSLPVLNVMINSKVVKYDLGKEVDETLKVLDFDFQTKARKLAGNIKNTIPLIYASNDNEILAKKWKISFNENSKTSSFYNITPEWNHNEINGFNNSNCEFSIIMINDKFEHEKIKKRVEVTTNLLKKKHTVYKIILGAKSKLARLFFGILYGDWISYELALLYNEDPGKVPIIQDLKKELKKENG